MADAGRVGWKCGMRPIGMKRPLSLFTVFLKDFSACSTVLVSPASARYLSQATAWRAQSAFSPRPINRGHFGVDLMRMGR